MCDRGRIPCQVGGLYGKGFSARCGSINQRATRGRGIHRAEPRYIIGSQPLSGHRLKQQIGRAIGRIHQANRWRRAVFQNGYSNFTDPTGRLRRTGHGYPGRRGIGTDNGRTTTDLLSNEGIRIYDRPEDRGIRGIPAEG